jgi:hypothetical protein
MTSTAELFIVKFIVWDGCRCSRSVKTAMHIYVFKNASKLPIDTEAAATYPVFERTHLYNIFLFKNMLSGLSWEIRL